MSPSATPATQSEGPCQKVPRLPRKVKVQVRMCDLCVMYVSDLYVCDLCVCVSDLCVMMCVCVCVSDSHVTDLYVSDFCVMYLCV